MDRCPFCDAVPLPPIPGIDGVTPLPCGTHAESGVIIRGRGCLESQCLNQVITISLLKSDLAAANERADNAEAERDELDAKLRAVLNYLDDCDCFADEIEADEIIARINVEQDDSE